MTVAYKNAEPYPDVNSMQHQADIRVNKTIRKGDDHKPRYWLAPFKSALSGPIPTGENVVGLEMLPLLTDKLHNRKQKAFVKCASEPISQAENFLSSPQRSQH